MKVVSKSTAADVPRWCRISLLVAAVQCLVWGLFIITLPGRSAIAYGLPEIPHELFLWQGTGLIIFLFGVGYGIAASNPYQHWAVVFVGLLAKVLGPLGMAWSVFQGEIPARVLLLIPINDVIWWIPFSVILLRSLKQQRGNGCDG